MTCKRRPTKKNSLKETEVIWLSLFPGQVIKNEKKKWEKWENNDLIPAISFDAFSR